MRALVVWILLASVCHSATAQQVLPDESGSATPNVIYWNTQNTTEGSPFQRNVETVIQFLYENNPPNGFATSLGYGRFPDIAYGHTACYNMSDQSSCAQCLQQAYLTIIRASPLATGGVFWFNNTDNRCRVRFEAYNFTSGLVPLNALGVLGPNASAPLPAPAPPTPSSAVPTPQSSSRAKARTPVIVGGILGGAGLCLFLMIGYLLCRRRYTNLDKGHRYRGPHSDLEGRFEGPEVFTYEELAAATGNFSETNKLGQGGFGSVYKANLADGSRVAVKKLSLQSHQGKREFVNEINIITSIQHRNLVRLKGYCVDGDERLLVYEFLENGSIDRALFDTEPSSLVLNWESRFQIAIGVARGLAYLHEESHMQIIHRDIKASNILLDENLQPKISDFGISKLFDLKKDFTSTNVAGTLGYMSPEYVVRGRLTSKVDVFAYGVLVLELISGRKCVDSTRPAKEELLVQHVWNLCELGRLEQCVDPTLGSNYDSDEVSRLVHVAMLCTQEAEQSRPAMSDVVAMLMRYLDLRAFPSQPPLYFGRVLGSSSSITNTLTTISTR